MDISLRAYLLPDDLRKLCAGMNMPAEVTSEVVRCACTCDFSAAEAWFAKLFDVQTGGEATKAIGEAYHDSRQDLRGLTVYLAAALRAGERYERLGIPELVYRDTMAVFSRFVGEHMASFGVYGFDRDYWIYRHLSLCLFRLGALEFEMRPRPDAPGLERFAPQGAAVLSVHIPSNAVMTRAALDESYAAARAFFPRYFPGFAYSCIYCSTWLLAPALREHLPPESRILNFQADYEIISRSDVDTNCVKWIFKQAYEPAEYAALPENTSLQRSVKAALLAGKTIGSALGVYAGGRR